MSEIVQKTIQVDADTKKIEQQIKNLKKSVEATNINLDVNTTATQNEIKSVTGTVKNLEAAYNSATKAKTGLERGASGTGGVSNATRDFSRQAQGLGGLVHVYAAVAANVYATSEAFSALSKAMDVVLMKESMDKFAATTGQNIAAIADSMQKITEGALKLPDAVRLTNLGTSSGLTAKQLEQLTIGAKGASAALGRDLSDSMDRVVRGIAKIEPELLDELGVTIRAGQAYKEYAAAIGASADELTGYQRTQAYAAAVSNQLLEKYEAISKEVPVNAFTKLAAAIKTATDSALGFVGTAATPLIDSLLAAPNAITAGLIAATAKLTQLALPSILSFKDRALKEAEDLQTELDRVLASANTAKAAPLAGLQAQELKQQRLLAASFKDATSDMLVESKELLAISSNTTEEKKKLLNALNAIKVEELDINETLKLRNQLESVALADLTTAENALRDYRAGTLKLSKEQVVAYETQFSTASRVLDNITEMYSVEEKNKAVIQNIAKIKQDIALTQQAQLPVAMQLQKLEAQHAVATAQRKATLIDVMSVYGVTSREAANYRKEITTANLEFYRQKDLINGGSGALSAMRTHVESVKTGIMAAGVAAGKFAGTLASMAFGLPGLALALAAALYEPVGKALGMINKYQEEVESASEGLKKFAESSEQYFTKVERKLQDAQIGTEAYSKIVQHNTTNIEDLTTAIEKQMDALTKYRKEYEGSNWFQKLFMTTPDSIVSTDVAKSLLQALQTASTDAVGSSAISDLLSKTASKEQLSLLANYTDKLKALQAEYDKYVNARDTEGVTRAGLAIKALKDEAAGVQQLITKYPELAEKIAELRRNAAGFLVSFEKPAEALNVALDKVGVFAPELDANIARLQEPVNTLTASMREQLGVLAQYQKTGNVSALEAVFKNTQGYIDQTLPKAKELIQELTASGKFKEGQGEAALAALDANIAQLKAILERSAQLDFVLANVNLPKSLRDKALAQRAALLSDLQNTQAATSGLLTGTLAGASDKANKVGVEKDKYQALLDQARLFLELEKSTADVLKERIDLNAKLGILSEAELFSNYQKAALAEQSAQYELTKITIAKQAQDAAKNGLSYDKARALTLAEQTNALKVQAIEYSTSELKANAALTAARQDLELKREMLRVAKDYSKLATQFGGMSTAEAASIEIQAEMLEMQSQRNKTQEQLNSLKVNEAKLSFDDFQNAINKQQYLERSLELQDANYQLYLKIAPLQQQANIAQQQYNNYLNAYNSVLGTIYQAEANITLLKEKQNAYIEAQVALINASTNKSPEEKRLETIALISQEYDKLKAKELDFGINISSSDSIVSGMQSAIKSADQLRVIFENQVLAQEELAKRMDSIGASEKTRAKELSKLNKQNFRDNLAGYASLAGAAASLFDRESAQAKALYDLEKMLAIATLAMDAQKLASKLGLIGAEQAHAVAAGTTAVLTQGAGDPYTAWPRIAAMTAVVAGLLAGIGTNLTGSSVTVAPGALGGSGVDSPVGSTESSKSLSAAETYLADIEADQYIELRKIFTEMQNLNSNITGFVTALYTSGDIRSIGANPVGVGFKDNPVAESLRNLGDSFNSIPVVGNILSGVGNFIGNAVSSVFGGGTSTSVTGSGLYMPDFTLGSGLDLKSYTDYKKKTDGGWFGKSKTSYYSKYADISGQSEAAFQAVFTNLREGILSIGDALNRDIESQVNSFTISIGKIATSGKTGAEIEQALQEAISTQSDKLAYAIFPDLVTKYAKLNEGYFETLIRLVTDKAVVESTLGDMGITLAMSADVIDVTQNLVKLSGSLSDFVSNSNEFVDKFYSDEQKFGITTRKVNDLFTYLNIEIPDSAEALVDLVTSLDLTTESGQEAFVSITKATELLDSYYREIETGTESVEEAYARLKAVSKTAADIAQERINLELELFDLTANTVQKRQAELAALDESNRGLQRTIYAIENADLAFAALQKAIEAEKKTLQEAYNARVESLNVEKKALEDTKSAMDAMSKSLKSAYDSIFKTIANPMLSYKQAQASLVNIAASGVLPEQEYLNSLLSAATTNDTKYYSTFEDYARDQATTGLAISSILNVADTELSVAKAQLLVIEDTLTTLKRNLDFDIAALDAQLSYYQKQLDALKGIDTQVLSVQAAISKMESSLAAAISGALAARAPSALAAPYSANDTPADRQAKVEYQTGQVVSASDSAQLAAAKVLYQSVTGGANTAQYNAALAAIGGSFSNIGWDGSREGAAALVQRYGGTLPSFDVGTNYIPEDMIAQVHKGEMIVPAKYNPTTSGIQVNEALLEEIRALRQEVSELKAQDRQIGVQLIKSTVKTADYIEKWDSTGLKTEAV